MKNLGELKAYGYGIMIFSPEKFNQFLKDRKCRAKKYLTYFDKNKETFFDLIKAGILLPFYRISAYEYEIFTTINETKISIPRGYEQIYCYKDFYVQVGNRKLCFANFEFLDAHKEMIDREQSDYGEEIPTGPKEIMEWYNYALGLELETGEYQFDIYGLKRIDLIERESKNFGFLFAFRKAENAVNDNFHKCDNDKYNFDIEQC
jgi:hypothetical protein